MKVRMSSFLVLVFVVLLLSVSGCSWFADNPMFPKAKIRIDAEVVTASNAGSTASNDGSTASNDGSATSNAGSSVGNPGLVRFTFTPLNMVGVRITQYKLEYRKIDNTSLPRLTSTIGTNIDVIPPGTPMASNAGLEDFSVTREIDLLPPDVEAYLKANRIAAVVVAVTFSGVDYASHPVSYRGGEFRVNVLEGVPEAELEFFCVLGDSCASCPSGSLVQVGCVLKVDDPGAVTKVEFFINGEEAGVDTSPPFISETVGVSPYGRVVGAAVIYDINGGVSLVTQTAEISDICLMPSPSPRAE